MKDARAPPLSSSICVFKFDLLCLYSCACLFSCAAGQAVLQLPLAGADVALQLPPALQLAATPAGHIDCRLQLFGVTVDWPAQRQQPHAAAGAQRF
jgi:hypothetical protein